MESASRPTIILRRARPLERDAVEKLLVAAGLPTEGVADHFGHFFVGLTAGAVVGAIGVELYGSSALLRSAVVDPSARNRGVGALLAQRAVDHARDAGANRVFLLTETAERYFARHGFRTIPRSDAAPELAASAEMRSCCGETAVCMVLDLPQG